MNGGGKKSFLVLKLQVMKNETPQQVVVTRDFKERGLTE
jgi:hypothetical protein